MPFLEGTLQTSTTFFWERRKYVRVGSIADFLSAMLPEKAAEALKLRATYRLIQIGKEEIIFSIFLIVYLSNQIKL